MVHLSDQQFQELKDFLAEQQRDLIIASHQSKDKETSSLHREILDKLTSHEIWRDELNTKLDKIDRFMAGVDTHMARVEPLIKKVEPLIEKSEEQKIFKKKIEKGLNSVSKYAKFIASLGVIGGAVIYIIKKSL